MSDATAFFISKFRRVLENSWEPGRYYRPRPYRNAVVRFRRCSIWDFEQRRDILVSEAGLNTFLFRADMIPGCDLLSDSGTTTMTMEQWAEMFLGDEAYGSNEGFFELRDRFADTFGAGWCDEGNSMGGSSESLFLFHQGRAAENAFFTVLARELARAGAGRGGPLSEGLLPELRARIESRCVRSPAPGASVARIIPSNSHFDTTQGNIEDKGMIALNLPCLRHLDNDETYPFRGNMNVEELENLLECERERVPLVYLTITNNTAGGQPVSVDNIRRIRKVTKAYGVPFFLDACRFAENAWFVQRHEEEFAHSSIREIVHEMFRYVDGFHISLKKDGLANMGGALVVRRDGDFARAFPRLREGITDYQIMAEGHPTYGGMAGRDLKAVAEGLRTVIREDYLDSRIGQVARFGAQFDRHRIPIVKPVGGHAVYIDLDRLFDGTAADVDFKGISFAALVLLAGHRVCELGCYAFGSFDGVREIPPAPRVNLVRAAVPRLVYEDQDLFSVVEAFKVLADHRDMIPGVAVEYGRELSLRHFKSRFSFKA